MKLFYLHKKHCQAICAAFFTFSFSLLVFTASAQKTVTTLDEAIKLGLTNNGNVQVAKTNVELQSQGKRAAFNLGKTDVGVQYGQYNSFETDLAFNINQNFEFPTVYTSQRKLAKAKTQGSQYQLSATENGLKRNIRQAWYQLAYFTEKQKMLMYQDTIFAKFLNAATIRYETEATSYLEKVAAETRVMELQNALKMIAADILIQEQELRVLLNDSSGVSFAPAMMEERALANMQDQNQVNNNPILSYAKQQVEIAQAEKGVQNSKMLPDLSIGYFNQSLIGSPITNTGVDIATSSDRFSGIQAGISIPLFFGSYRANVKSAKLNRQIAQTNADYYQTVIQGQYQQLLNEVLKYQGSLSYYKEKAVPQADLIINNTQKSFDNGAINYVEYFQNINQGLALKFNYLETLNGYNQAVINLEYLIGQ